MSATEANFDGLVGPTHNYSGLAQGNLASAKNALKASNPREAALQGLAKMRALADLGLSQGVLPPQERPHLATLRSLGFGGKDADLLKRVLKEAPGLLAATASASSMWTANAATVSPSADTADGRVHFTPANLATHLHRSLEPPLTARALAATFPDTRHFAHHPPLPGTPDTADEGAANHTRLATAYGDAGVEVFVYGRGGADEKAPTKFPARQTRAASEAVARLHGLSPERTVFVQQAPDVIDAGVFHNDVIAVGNREVWLAHEKAFDDPAAVRIAIGRAMPEGTKAVLVTVPENELTVADAVSSYFFNSQLVCPPAGPMTLVCAAEVRENARAWACAQRILEDPANPVGAVQVFDLRQSMNNGGGPACLRLRVVLTEAEAAAVNARSWIDAARHAELEAWVRRHYRDRLVLDDLADPELLDETRTALDRLTQILGLGSLYDFQRN